jgi:hypothetical protein
MKISSLGTPEALMPLPTSASLPSIRHELGSEQAQAKSCIQAYRKVSNMTAPTQRDSPMRNPNDDLIRRRAFSGEK